MHYEGVGWGEVRCIMKGWGGVGVHYEGVGWGAL